MRSPILQMASALLLAALPFAAAAAESKITVSDPYVRLAPPGAPASAAYLVIRNSSAADRQLVKAESPDAKTVEMHEHRNENGVMKMREVGNIVIKAHAQAELKPGGYHLMLIGVKKALKEGDSAAIMLVFDDGSRQQIVAPVRKAQADMPAGMAMDHGAMKH
jgi:copper(I)-binding protein